MLDPCPKKPLCGQGQNISSLLFLPQTKRWGSSFNEDSQVEACFPTSCLMPQISWSAAGTGRHFSCFLMPRLASFSLRPIQFPMGENSTGPKICLFLWPHKLADQKYYLSSQVSPPPEIFICCSQCFPNSMKENRHFVLLSISFHRRKELWNSNWGKDTDRIFFNLDQKYNIYQPGLNSVSLAGMCLTPSGKSNKIYKEMDREREIKLKMPWEMELCSPKADYETTKLGTSVHSTEPSPRKQLWSIYETNQKLSFFVKGD